MSGPGSPPGPGAAPDPPSIWRTRRAVLLHLTLVVVVPAFVGLFWWQVQRVRQGNTLSWAYVFEWPFFTGYAINLWWKLVHDQAADGSTPGPARSTPSLVPGQDGPSADDAGPVTNATAAALVSPDGEDEATEDEELAAYNRYLAMLNASGRRKRW